jgi:hypothetical protein
VIKPQELFTFHARSDTLSTIPLAFSGRNELSLKASVTSPILKGSSFDTVKHLIAAHAQKKLALIETKFWISGISNKNVIVNHPTIYSCTILATGSV